MVESNYRIISHRRCGFNRRAIKWRKSENIQPYSNPPSSIRQPIDTTTWFLWPVPGQLQHLTSQRDPHSYSVVPTTYSSLWHVPSVDVHVAVDLGLFSGRVAASDRRNLPTSAGCLSSRRMLKQSHEVRRSRDDQ